MQRKILEEIGSVERVTSRKQDTGDCQFPLKALFIFVSF